jgi:signal peptidase
MAPGLRAGDLAVIRRQDTYRIGDAVTYRIPAGEFRGRQIIHRIVGGDAAGGFAVQGDNKGDVDRWQPKERDIVGRLWVRIPLAGRVLASARAPTTMAAVAGGVAFAIILTWPSRRREEAKVTSPVRGELFDRDSQEATI